MDLIESLSNNDSIERGKNHKHNQNGSQKDNIEVMHGHSNGNHGYQINPTKYKNMENHYYHCYCRDHYVGDGIHCDPVQYQSVYQSHHHENHAGYHKTNGHHS